MKLCSKTRRIPPWTAWFVCVCLAVFIAGCGSDTAETRPPAPMATADTDSGPASKQDLQDQIDAVLEYTLRQRRLNTVDHGAWQILHGVLAYQQHFPVHIGGADGEEQPAVEYALNGGAIDGFTLQPGEILDAETGRRGLRAIVEPGTKRGQGHNDQWLAILAQCGLPIDQTIQVNGQTFTVLELVQQVQRDVPRNVEREWSWTLIGLTSYLPTTATWTASDDKTWSIERLLASEIRQDLSTSACGGTHRVIGIAMALNRHLSQGGQLTGNWREADQLIQQTIAKAKEYQNPDGSFSSNYFDRPGQSPDLAVALGTSGHILEFLTLSMTDEQLAEPWVTRSVSHLCRLFRDTEHLALECGALYHAAHGLVVYRQRRYGDREYTIADERAENASAAGE